MHDHQALGSTCQRHVERGEPVRCCVQDPVWFDEDDHVELQALRGVGRENVGHALEVQVFGGDDGHRPAADTTSLVLDGPDHRSGEIITSNPTSPRAHTARPYRRRRPAGGIHLGEHDRGELHDLGRCPVVDGQLPVGPPPRDVALQHHLPGARTRRRLALRQITHNGAGPARATSHDDPPVHLGQFLRLVQDDMTIGPPPIRDGTLGGRAVIGFTVACGEPLRVDQIDRAELLTVVVRLVVGAVQDFQHSSRVLEPVPLALVAVFVGVAPAQQLGGFVQQRDVGDRPHLPGPAKQQLAVALVELVTRDGQPLP